VRHHDRGCPTVRDFVQSHDMLYKASLDILYTRDAFRAAG